MWKIMQNLILKYIQSSLKKKCPRRLKVNVPVLCIFKILKSKNYIYAYASCISNCEMYTPMQHRNI